MDVISGALRFQKCVFRPKGGAQGGRIGVVQDENEGIGDIRQDLEEEGGSGEGGMKMKKGTDTPSYEDATTQLRNRKTNEKSHLVNLAETDVIPRSGIKNSHYFRSSVLLGVKRYVTQMVSWKK